MLKRMEKMAAEASGGGGDEEEDSSDDEDAVQSRRTSSIENDCAQTNSKNPMRWEKAVVALNGMVNQVSKVDPDGLDIVCFGGGDDEHRKPPNIYRNVRNTKDVERLVTAKMPSGPCYMGEAMEIVLKEAFDRGLSKRPCGILVLTAGQPADKQRLENALRNASNTVARMKKKESPLTVTFVHVGDDLDAEEYMRFLDANMGSTVKNSHTKEKENIVDTVKDTEIKAAMQEIKGTHDSGKTGAIVGAFAGAAMGVGGLYMYNKKQAKKKTQGWNGKWKVTYDGMEVASLKVNDDMKGSLIIDGFPGGRTIGKYSEKRSGYAITFRDADENWIIKGSIEDEHTIYWNDGTVWTEIEPKGANKFGHYAGAAAAGAATGGAVGYLLDKKFFKKAHKKDQADYVIVIDRSAMMAIKDEQEFGYDDDDGDDDGEEDGMFGSMTKKFNDMDTGDKVAAGILGTVAVAGTVGLGVAGVHAVKDHQENKKMQVEHETNHEQIKEGYEGPEYPGSGGPHAAVATTTTGNTTRSMDQDDGMLPASLQPKRKGLNGRYRATFDGDEIAVVNVQDDEKGSLIIRGFIGGTTVGKYQTDHLLKIKEIHFMDADEQWPVKGEVKGAGFTHKTNIIVWGDGTRWDRIG